MRNKTKDLLTENGYQIIQNVTTPSIIKSLKRLSGKFKNESTEIRKNVFDKCDETLALFKEIESLLKSYTPNCIMTPYCFYLEKTDAKNWPLKFHQDVNFSNYLSLTKREIDSWLKKGFWVRVNLDANDQNTGAIKVIPKSHINGKNTAFDKKEAISLNVEEGDIVLFHPLLYHGSDKMTKVWERKIFQCIFLQKANE